MQAWAVGALSLRAVSYTSKERHTPPRDTGVGRAARKRERRRQPKSSNREYKLKIMMSGVFDL